MTAKSWKLKGFGDKESAVKLATSVLRRLRFEADLNNGRGDLL
jgi:hypothetical protein